MQDISGKRFAVLATHGFEQSDFEVPLQKLREAGASSTLSRSKPARSRAERRRTGVDRTLDEAKASDYDALVLPGGQMNPDLLRVEKKAIDFVKPSGTTAK